MLKCLFKPSRPNPGRREKIKKCENKNLTLFHCNFQKCTGREGLIKLQAFKYCSSDQCFSIFFHPIYMGNWIKSFSVRAYSFNNSLKKCLSYLKRVLLWKIQLYSQRLPHRCFPVNFAKFLRTCFVEHLRIANSVFFNIKSYLRYKTIFAIK